MSNPNHQSALSVWNKEPKLGSFFGVQSVESEPQPLLERFKLFATWVCGTALTTPSQAPDHMREHFPNHQSNQDIAA